MSSFFSKERLKALADQAKAGASQLQSQAQQGLQRMQTQRRTSSREGTGAAFVCPTAKAACKLPRRSQQVTLHPGY